MAYILLKILLTRLSGVVRRLKFYDPQ